MINVGRGAHLIEDDLSRNLESGRISRAFLDVFNDEPLKDAHPFWTHPKIRITPHIAAITLVEESVNQIRNKIEAIESGAPITGAVDRALRY